MDAPPPFFLAGLTLILNSISVGRTGVSCCRAVKVIDRGYIHSALRILLKVHRALSLPKGSAGGADFGGGAEVNSIFERERSERWV